MASGVFALFASILTKVVGIAQFNGCLYARTGGVINVFASILRDRLVRRGLRVGLWSDPAIIQGKPVVA
jgi:hypothetical protein